MLSFLFRTRHRLTLDLAVERERRAFLEHDNLALRAQLQDVTREYARFRDETLARLGAISAPITDAAASSARPRPSIWSALAVTEVNAPLPPPEPMMPAE
jgi:hypothetical protein